MAYNRFVLFATAAFIIAIILWSFTATKSEVRDHIALCS